MEPVELVELVVEEQEFQTLVLSQVDHQGLILLLLELMVSVVEEVVVDLVDQALLELSLITVMEDLVVMDASL